MNTALTFSVSVTQAPLQFRRLTADVCGCTWEQCNTFLRWLRCHTADTELTSKQHATWKADCLWSHRQRRCVRLQRGTPEDQTLCHYQIIVSVDSGHDAPSLHERGLVVGIQTADIQSKKMVYLTKTQSRSQRQRWLTASLAASLLRSGNSCKKSFCFTILKARTHTHTHIGMLQWIMRLLIQCHPTSVWGYSYSELSHNFHSLRCCQRTVKGLRPRV